MRALQSERPLIVYLDFKSPYAYLAWQPTRDMAREIGIEVDWRPLVLDIPSFLGSAKLGKSGKVAAQQRSDDQWGWVKYAYFDCRRYANLRGLTIRGTTKIWDTNLAAIGMLWAKRQGDEILEAYVGAIYEPFWKRQLDLEDPAVIASVLGAAGADLAGFNEYRQGEGAARNSALQAEIFDAGIFGVPTYVVDGEFYFGREHLPRLRWLLSGRSGPAPDIANELDPDADIEQHAVDRLELCVDFHCPQSYLCLAPTIALARDTHRPITWYPRTSGRRRLEPKDESRGARHRSFRQRYIDRVAERYAGHAIPPGGPDSDSALPAMTLLWLQQTAPEKLDDFVVGCFEALWKSGRSFTDAASITTLLSELGIHSDGLMEFLKTDGVAALATSQASSSERGCRDTPTYFIGEEPFVDYQHLPLIRARLGY
jgi:2-hydroxychromene-2-carboxylate isomerase